MPVIRRSLRPPGPNEPYLTEDHNVIRMIKRALERAEQGNRDRLHAMAAEIGVAWMVEDDDGRVRLALFGCEVLRLVRPYLHNPRISEAFLDAEIQSLRTLRWALNGEHPRKRQNEFLEALHLGGLHDEWLHDIRKQAMEVLLSLKEIGDP
ncbi:hypothetical protein DER44DRAFT_796126 [Fusarium oxysporum]|nr:hypothetical protein DER44DRAFT_796126 [Fusarium oxysporum]